MVRLLTLVLTLLALLGLERSLSVEKWCFANVDSINGPFVSLWHSQVLGERFFYVSSMTLREPGFQCRSLAAFGQGPSLCRSLLPITRHFYWNNISVQGWDGLNCSACSYHDVPTGGPWPRISCDEIQ